MDNDRIATAKNRVFYSDGMGFGRDNPISLHTLPTSVYRTTGMDQIADIINCGYVRPKEGHIKGGHKNEVFWSVGSERTFYYNGRPVLETSIEKVKDGQIGSLSLDDLTSIWIFDYEQNCYFDKKDVMCQLRKMSQETGIAITPKQIEQFFSISQADIQINDLPESKSR